MIEIRSRLKSLTDKEKWAARRASFVAKAQATKVVWFPPEPVETGTQAASAAKKATRKTASGASKRASSSAKKTTGAAKKATGAAKKTTARQEDAPGTKRVAGKA